MLYTNILILQYKKGTFLNKQCKPFCRYWSFDPYSQAGSKIVHSSILWFLHRSYVTFTSLTWVGYVDTAVGYKDGTDLSLRVKNHPTEASCSHVLLSIQTMFLLGYSWFYNAVLFLLFLNISFLLFVDTESEMPRPSSMPDEGKRLSGQQLQFDFSRLHSYIWHLFCCSHYDY